MPAQPIMIGSIAVDLKPSPINPAWIRAGTPTARNAVLSNSRDRASCTVVWDCTPGEFEWHYDSDETIHILEGSVVLDDGVAPPRRLGPGDVVLFPQGAVVKWKVESHLRKLAFFHRSLPAPIALVSRVVAKAKSVLRRILLPNAKPQAASMAPGMGDLAEVSHN
ncbi:cupin domain-containing protein [Lichenibacterium minor]